MTAVYQLVSSGASPLSLAAAKAFLKVSGTAEDTIIQSIIDACTEWGESYTRRSFRAQVWTLLLDEFGDPIPLRRQPVDTITAITHLVSGSPVTVDAANYYLKQTPQGAEVLLTATGDWPDTTDDREQAITVNFTTAPWTRHASVILEALQRHVAAMYANRGDCPDCTATDYAVSSGADALYDMLRVARV